MDYSIAKRFRYFFVRLGGNLKWDLKNGIKRETKITPQV